MKKIISVLLVVMMIFSMTALVACGGGGSSEPTEPPTPAPTPTPRTYTDADFVGISLVKHFKDTFEPDGLQVNKLQLLLVDTQEMADALNAQVADKYAGDDTAIANGSVAVGDWLMYLETRCTNYDSGQYVTYKMGYKCSNIYGDDAVTYFTLETKDYEDYLLGTWGLIKAAGYSSLIQQPNGRVVLQIVDGNLEWPAELTR